MRDIISETKSVDKGSFMEIIKYDGFYPVDEAIKNNEPLLAVISFDGKKAVVSHIEEAVEHHILLMKTNHAGTAIDKYFRILFDKSGADWTFICPPDYKNISDRRRRIAAFYRDGNAAISELLSELGYFIDIKIPERYSRHLRDLGE